MVHENSTSYSAPKGSHHVPTAERRQAAISTDSVRLSLPGAVRYVLYFVRLRCNAEHIASAAQDARILGRSTAREQIIVPDGDQDYRAKE